jgi:hypothetical protein
MVPVMKDGKEVGGGGWDKLVAEAQVIPDIWCCSMKGHRVYST